MKKNLHVNFLAQFGQAIADQAPEQPKLEFLIRPLTGLVYSFFLF